MRMRIALSALAAALIAVAAVGGNVTAASAETSVLSTNLDMVHCC
jgi:ABC-type glycerol-3-phosphate transport system substrate-binding protein